MLGLPNEVIKVIKIPMQFVLAVKVNGNVLKRFLVRYAKRVYKYCVVLRQD